MRASKLDLTLDNNGLDLIADGSDMVTVVAKMKDSSGTTKTLNNQLVKFTIEGEGRIVGGTEIGANPKALVQGTAPVLIQSTTKPGRIKVHAAVLFKGEWTPEDGEIVFNSVKNEMPFIANPRELAAMDSCLESRQDSATEPQKAGQQRDERQLQEVEKQQTDFGKGLNDGQ